ncbi:MAG: transporter substrate-binding domain-containing protein [Treponema sp.]|nr:transporter substrate-binding domain-containing protein [Treponema sp.]
MKIKKVFFLRVFPILPVIAMALILIFVSDCSSADNNESDVRLSFSEYRDIPGITSEEIKAIEAILEKKDYFIYGMIPSTETFLNESGEVSGYSALVCRWLSELFGIPFVPQRFSWHGLLDGMESKEIDFSGDLTANEERRKTYFMTDAIAQRSIKYYRIAGSSPFSEIRQTRKPRYVLQEKNTITADVLFFSGGTFDPVYVLEYDEVYDLLKSGEADALITEGVQEDFFDVYGDVVVSEFFPLIYSPVSLSTQNSELEPIISAVQKALENGGIRYLSELYDQGYQDYLRNKLYMRLTEEEKQYIKDNPVIPFGAEYDNYPISFFSTRSREWQGICFDALEQLESLTGFKFSIVNDERTDFYELLRMLENGEIYIVSELIQTTDREGRFIWPVNAFMTDQSVLISRVDYRNINVNRVYSERVGVSKGTAHSEFFFRWFPNHLNTIEYENQGAAIDALTKGDVDMVMNSFTALLHLTNYLELPNFKVNIMFENYFDSTFGINKNHEILRSIIDKALILIDTKAISEQWRHKTYDYRLKLIQAQMPLLIGSIVLSLCVLFLVIILFGRSRHTGKKLEELVEKRTYELALQTTTLTTLFDSIPDLIFTKNSQLNFLHCNKAFLEHFGKDIDDLVGKSDEEGLGVTAEEAEGFNSVDRKVIWERRTLALEERIPCVDGTKPYYETIKMPLMLDGNVVGIMGIARNITKRKEVEERMASRYESSKKLSDALANITKSPTISTGVLKDAADVIAKDGGNALNTSYVGVWMFSEETGYLENISHYNVLAGELSVLDSIDLFANQEYMNLLKSERIIIMNNPAECKLITSNFEGYDNLCAALDSPIRIDGKFVGVVCVEQEFCGEFHEKREWAIEEQNFASSLADLMALAISGSERRKAREAAETASQTKSAFLANMSHEIRTPMNAILGVTEILIQYETLPAEIEEGLGKIYSSCDLLLGIINDILDFSKIEAGKLDIMPAQYKVASLINDSVHLNMMRIDSKPIEFELHVDENVPAKLIGDELRIKQILNNLLSNAFKYTDAGKVTLSVVSINTKEGVTLMLSVRDTGHGMTKDQLSKLFDEYSRFNRDKNISIEGTGLGLAITQRLVHLMDGDIFVESKPEIGTYFIVRLPQKTIDTEVLGKEVVANLRQFRMNYITHRKRGQIARDPMPYGSVLIVDDVETNLYVAVGLMKLYKLQIDTAMSGQEAIDKVNNGKVYDIIFMDHMMPEMDGIEATKYLRNSGYTAPIIALTANAVAGQADVFLQNGFDEFISKPIDIRQLNSVLNKLIRDKQSPETIEAARRQKAETNGIPAPQPFMDSLLLESFIRDARKAITWLENQKNIGFDNIENKEEVLRKFTITVHGIKSSLWNIGETVLAELAYNLEKCGREQNVEQITASTPGFINDLHVLLEKLESRRDESSSDPVYTDDDIYNLRSKFRIIKEMCADYNRKGALDAIAEIKKHTKETKEVLDTIMGFVLHSDFEQAESVAAGYLADLPGILLNREIAGLDINKGLERYEGDEKTYLKVLRSYAASVRSMLSVVEEVSEETLEIYKIKVHGIKGTSLDICAELTGKDAKALEEAAKSGDFGYIKKHNPAFLENTKKLVLDIDDLLNCIEAENPKPKKDKPDTELLLKLLTACKSYDMDGADEAMAEMEKYKYEADDGLADWLRDNVDIMNFTQIVQKLSDLIK